MPTQTFYPPISNLVEIDNLPDELGFVKDGLSNLLSKIYYRDLQFSKNAKGDAAFYSLQIVSLQRIDIEIPGTGIFSVHCFSPNPKKAFRNILALVNRPDSCSFLY